MELSNKRIVITGGTAGIGLEMVKQLCRNNEVIVIARDESKLKALAQTLVSVRTFQADLSNMAEVASVAQSVTRQFESIDILICNAAVQYTPMLLDDDFRPENIQREVNLNFTGIGYLVHGLLPSLHKDTPSSILLINSALALTSKKTSAVYCGTKAALNGFAQSLRYQLENTNIMVQQAFLPLVDTAMTQGRGKHKMSANKAAEQILRGLALAVVDNDIGKVRWLRLLLRLAPSFAQRILKHS
ncbi:SDR family NAD(P)-dependent oxidoreductase [Marinagarivorans cellulosilyticus]|uniref:Oxidoreductase n=1 Tax=Marinagarivorans cellulosilyticus TaxID=2721545 RepID=A0AAN1WGI1_9GAMM|nr:SDR family NAD(P)-dependent oxidoreductase [Marinagarivorans cellulosilyticus]BCD97115.1 hypothetical protein MARGE09_P1315 [Marinagarivorans cellulosilyticus]